jgi:hypothetical protein
MTGEADDAVVVDVAEVEPVLPKWCKAVVYDSERNVVALRTIVPTRDRFGRIGNVPVEFVMTADAARALVKALGRCADAASALVIEVS